MEVVRIKKILVRNLFIYIGLHCVRSSSWTVTTLATLLKVAIRENDIRGQFKKFQSLVSLAKSDHNETLNKLLELIKIKPNGDRKNKIWLLDAELKANGEALKHKHALLAAMIERKKIRKLC